MDAEYLKTTVGETLASGLAAMVMAEPADPVDYLGKWLQNYVKTVQDEEKENEAILAQRMQDEAEEDLHIKEEQQKLLRLKVQRDAITERHQKIADYLAEEQDFKHIWNKFINIMQKGIGCSAIYVARLEESGDKLTYFSATENQEFMIEKTLSKPAPSDGGELEEEGGIIFGLFEAKEADDADDAGDGDANDDDSDNKVAKLPVAPQIRSIMVPNVLMGPQASRIKFFNMQQTGAFYACLVEYDATLNPKTLDQAVAKAEQMREDMANPDYDDRNSSDDDAKDSSTLDDATQTADDDEATREDDDVTEARKNIEAEQRAKVEEDEILSAIKCKQMRYVVCYDTLGQNRRFTLSEVDYINKYTLQLAATLERIDRNFFKSERKFQADLHVFNRVHVQRMAETLDEDELSQFKQSLEDKEEDNTDADVAYLRRRTRLTAPQARKQLMAFRDFHVFRGDMEVAQAFFYHLGFSKEDMCEKDNIPDWGLMKQLFEETLITKIKTHDPRDLSSLEENIEEKEEQKGTEEKNKEEKKEYNTDAAVAKMIEGHEVDDIKETNAVLAEMLGFVQDSLALRQQAKQEREQSIADAKEAEEAERERLAQEEADRKAADDGDEGDEGDDSD